MSRRLARRGRVGALAAALLGALLGLGAAAPQASPAPVHIRSDLLVAEGKKDQAVFTGHVHVAQDGYVLTCERLVVTYGEGRRVRRLVATGAVRLTQGERLVEARRAELDNATGVITLTGEPVLTQGENVVHGETVVVDLRADTVRVEQVEAKVRMNEVIEAGGGK